MNKPLLIDPDAPKMLDDMLAEVLESQFPTDKPESRKIKAATMAAAIRAMMKKEGLTVIREADMIVMQGERKEFTNAELEASGVTEGEFIHTVAATHMASVARSILDAGLLEFALGAKDGTDTRAVVFTTRLFLPGFAAVASQRLAEHEAAGATIQ